MAKKPEIQYVGQFYVYGSEAPQLEEQVREKVVHLEMPKLEQIRQVKIDPIAVVSLFAAVILLVSMVVGTIRIEETWREYDAMETYLTGLRAENAALTTSCSRLYDMKEVEAAALSMGLVPISELKTMDITVTIPRVQEDPSPLQEAWEDFLWFMDGLFE